MSQFNYVLPISSVEGKSPSERIELLWDSPMYDAPLVPERGYWHNPAWRDGIVFCNDDDLMRLTGLSDPQAARSALSEYMCHRDQLIDQWEEEATRYVASTVHRVRRGGKHQYAIVLDGRPRVTGRRWAIQSIANRLTNLTTHALGQGYRLPSGCDVPLLGKAIGQIFAEIANDVRIEPSKT